MKTHRFKEASHLGHYLNQKLPEIAYPTLVGKDLALKIKERGPHSALWRQFVPQIQETESQGTQDPIGDTLFLKAPQLIHRYRSKALFLPTHACPVLCRYCFRKSELSPSHPLFQGDFEKTLHYLRLHPEIRELIFSGGDPFVLSPQKMSLYLKEFAKISSIRWIRFHTRSLCANPKAISDELLETLHSFTSFFSQITLVFHINHPEELDWPDTQEAIGRLQKGPLKLLSQTVLLRGVNDHAETLTTLFETLSQAQITPYYLHHPDPAQGTAHFALSQKEGLALYRQVKSSLPGWMVPQYVVETDEGGGKVPTSMAYERSWASNENQ